MADSRNDDYGTKVRFLDTFLDFVTDARAEIDLGQLAHHISEFPDDGVGSDVSDHLRVMEWTYFDHATETDKPMFVWFLVVDSISTIFVIAADFDTEPDDDDDNRPDAIEKLDRISRIIYRIYRLGEHIADLFDKTGSLGGGL